MDEQTKEALKAGKLPGWTKIAREAIEQALARMQARDEKIDNAQGEIFEREDFWMFREKSSVKKTYS